MIPFFFRLTNSKTISDILPREENMPLYRESEVKND